MENKLNKSASEEGRGGLSRREFFAGAGGAALSFSIMNPGLARGSQVSSKISLGSIGCGSRGTWIADLFRKHGGYEITAAHDYFPDRVNAFGDKYNVPAARRFTGLKGFQRMLEAKVDAVAIESPPYFHHLQAAAAIEAGVHVYVAKPMAVDVPGCHSIEASAMSAAEKKIALPDRFPNAHRSFLSGSHPARAERSQHRPHRQWRSIIRCRPPLGKDGSGPGSETRRIPKPACARGD